VFFLGYFDVNVGLPVTNAGMRILNISDLNNDKSNDMVTVDSEGKTVSVFYYDDMTGTFSNTATFAMPEGYLLDNIIPTNIPQGLQHLIVVASKKDTVTEIVDTQLFYYKQSEDTSADRSNFSWT